MSAAAARQAIHRVVVAASACGAVALAHANIEVVSPPEVQKVSPAAPVAPKPKAQGTPAARPPAASKARSEAAAAPPAATPPARPAAEMVFAPKLAVGDSWEFVRADDFDKSQLGKRNRLTIAKAGPAMYASRFGYEMSIGLGALNTVENGKVVRFHRPAAFTIDFPLTVGKRWSERWTSTSSVSGERVAQVVAEARVAAFENVRVPAGSFDAFRIEHSFRTTLSNGSVNVGRQVTWYAPSARYFAKIHYEYSRDNEPVTVRWTSELASLSLASP